MRIKSAHLLTTLLLAACAIAACSHETRPFESLLPPSVESAAPPERRTIPVAARSGTPSINPPTTQSIPAYVDDRLLDDSTRRVLKLSNGFTIILQQNKTAPVVAARIYVKAGALTEQKHMGAGISHVLEHLVAGASSGKRKEDENTLLLESIGNDSNAYTDEDHTCYFITTIADKWPIAIDLLIDFTTNTDFTREQFDREFQVVQRELEMDEAEADRMFYFHVQSNRYLQHPAKHPVIGYKPAFQKITYEDALAYYRQMYVPDNIIISIAGDIDLQKAEDLILSHLKDIPRKAVPAITLPQEPPVAISRRSIAHSDVKQARVQWAFPTTTMYSPDMYPTDVLASVLAGSESSLLVRRLRDELGLVINISAANGTPSYVEGALEFDAILAPEKIPAAEKALLSALEDVLKNGVSSEAVERAKAQAAAQLVFGNQTPVQQASRNALDFMATGNIDFTETYVKRIQAVTPEQVLAAARKFIQPDQMLVTTLLPLSAKDPFAAEAKAAATQTASAQVILQKTVLKNGLTLLISRNPAAPLAAFSLYTVGGLLAEDDATNGTGAAMMELLTRGTTSRSHEQITDFLDATGSTLSSESGNNSFALSMQCLKDKAPDAFALFAEIALHPRFSSTELSQIRPQLLAAIDEATEDWFGEAYKFTKESYYAASPYKRLSVGSADVISKLNSEAIRIHYENFFLNPQKMVLAIAGDIDPIEAAKWAAQFENIPQKSPRLNLTTTPAPPKTFQFPTEKQSATVMVAYPPGMPINSPDRHAMIVLQTYLGGYASQSGSALFDTLRGKGLVYTVQASLVTGPAGGMFLIAAQGEPKNAQPIVTTIQQIIDDTKKGQIPDKLLDLAKDQTITGEKLSKQTIADKSSSQALDEALGLGYDDETKFPEKIRSVTKTDVIRVANKYLLTPTVVIVTPEAKK